VRNAARPGGAIVFQSNHRPKFNSNDTGNRRRYLELPFDNALKDHPLVTLDTTLKQRLAEDPLVGQAVLAWIVGGSVAAHKDGLQIPECVRAATEELFQENDVLGEFWSDCVIADTDTKVPVKDLKEVYLAWCSGERSDPMSDREFTKYLH
jgi:putative DNA primase/helicase